MDTSAAGTVGNDDVDFYSISPNGRYVAFDSLSTNLVATPAAPQWHPYVRDLLSGGIQRVDISASGQPTPAPHATMLAAPYGGSIANDGTVVMQTSDPTLAEGDPGGFASHGRLVVQRPGGHARFAAYGGQGLITADGTRLVFYGRYQDFPPSQVLSVAVPGTDSTPPTVTGTPDRPANSVGWYNAPVTITWSVRDPAPGSGVATAPPPTLASAEGNNVTYTSGLACDGAQNCATGSLTLSIDTSSPLVSVTGLGGSGTYAVGDTLPSPGCSVPSDTLSGVASSSGPRRREIPGT